MGMRGAALVFGLLCTVGSTVVEAQYNSALAMSALYYCKASYCDAGTIGSWNCPPCSYHPSFTSVNVYHNMSIDSQGFTGYDTNSNTIVVAFRGSANIENWFSDLDFTFTTYPVAACNCQVHQGFFDEWLSLSSSVLADVRNLVSQYSGAQILVTGHSLGAAVSILAALDIVNEVTSSGVTVYNFGQPRVGDNSFAAYAAGMLPQGRQFRVTHGYDPVPHVPPMFLGFLHTPHELWYDNDGSTSWSSCQDSATAEDPNCSDSIIPLDISNHLLYLGVPTECTSSRKPQSAVKAIGSILWDAAVKKAADWKSNLDRSALRSKSKNRGI